MEKHYSPIDNITSIKMQYQKKSVTGNRNVGGSTTVTSICACRTLKYGIHHCLSTLGLEQNLLRGELILVIRRRFAMINGNPWYKAERWRIPCFSFYLYKMGEQETIAYPFSNIKQGQPSALRVQMGEKRFAEYQKFNNQLRMYTGRLKKYKSNNNPTQKTLAGMVNCEVKIKHFSELLERYTCPQNESTTLQVPNLNLNLQAPEPEEIKKSEMTWDPSTLHSLG